MFNLNEKYFFISERCGRNHQNKFCLRPLKRRFYPWELSSMKRFDNLQHDKFGYKSRAILIRKSSDWRINYPILYAPIFTIKMAGNLAIRQFAKYDRHRLKIKLVLRTSLEDMVVDSRTILNRKCRNFYDQLKWIISIKASISTSCEI